MTASLGGGEVEGGGIEQRGKRAHGHGQQCGDYLGAGGIRGLKCNGKKYNKDFFFNFNWQRLVNQITLK